VQNRVPRIADTMKDLGWKPRVDMREALKLIFDAYRTHVQDAAQLVE
jgi:nucleoside-diphosphate-sugar epimerase